MGLIARRASKLGRGIVPKVKIDTKYVFYVNSQYGKEDIAVMQCEPGLVSILLPAMTNALTHYLETHRNRGDDVRWITWETQDL